LHDFTQQPEAIPLGSGAMKLSLLIFGYSSGDRRLSSTSIVADMIPPMPRRAKCFSKFLQAGVTVPS
jgi:hypothetical protein